MPGIARIITGAAILALLGCGRPSLPSHTGESTMTEPVLAVDFHVGPDQLEISYAITNDSDATVLVFDSMYDMTAEALDKNWAYADFAGGSALIKRQMELLPQGLTFENPPVPYAREIAPSQKATGRFTLPLPIKATGPYLPILRRTEPVQVDVASIQLQVGWCAKPKWDPLPPYVSHVELEGQNLIMMPYSVVAGMQKTVRSAPRPIQVRGIDLR